MEKKSALKRIKDAFLSLYSSLYDMAFYFIAPLVWVVSHHITKTEPYDFLNSTVAGFVALTFWSTALKDGILVFNRENILHDTIQKRVVISACTLGVIVSTLLLAAQIFHSNGSLQNIGSFHGYFTKVLLVSGFIILWLIKAIHFERTHLGNIRGE